MRNFLAVAILAVASSLASAAPYLVYSGKITGSNFFNVNNFGPGAVNASTLVYLLTDLADTSNFAVLLVNASDKEYTVLARPSDSPTVEEGSNNFLGSVGGTAILSYSGENDNSTYDGSGGGGTVTRGYATGSVTTRSTHLVAARTKPLVVILSDYSVNGHSDTFVFSKLSRAIESGGLPFAEKLSGFASGYSIDSSGNLTATTPAVLSLAIDSRLTALANIGGGQEVTRFLALAGGREVKFPGSAAIMPVVTPDGIRAADAFAAWLAALAQAIGYKSASDLFPLSPIDTFSYSGSSAIGGGSYGVRGQLSSNNASSVDVAVAGGTLTLPGSLIGGVPEITLSSTNAFPDALAIGGLISPFPSAGSSLTVSDPNNSGATMTLDFTDHLGYIDGDVELPSPGQTEPLSGTLYLNNCDIFVATVSSNGTGNGTITIGGGGGSSFAFSGGRVTLQGYPIDFVANTHIDLLGGNVFAGFSTAITGGTVTNTNGSFSFANITVTSPPPQGGLGGGGVTVLSRNRAIGAKSTGSTTVGRPAGATPVSR
jgi:hypothetical protein